MNFIHERLISYLDERGARYSGLSDHDIHHAALDGTNPSVADVGLLSITGGMLKANPMMKLLKLVLLTVITPPVSPSNTRIIENIMTLPAPTPRVMFSMIQDMDPALPESDEEDDPIHSDFDLDQTSSRNGSTSPLPTLDQQLSFEAEMAKYKYRAVQVEREIADVKAEKEEIAEAYIRLQESYDAVKKQSADHEDQLKKINAAQNGVDQLSVKDLEAKVAQQEDTIARYEAQITDHESINLEMRRKLDKLNATAENFQKIQDDFQIQKVQLEQQTKKANAGEKYKQKVQASLVIEKERDALRQQLEESRANLKSYDDLRRRNARLEKENHEIGTTLSRSERDNNELRETKQTVLVENSRLQRDSKSLREALAQSQERVADLEESGGGSEIHSSPTVVDGGLENELLETSKHEDQLQVANVLLWWIRGLTFRRKLRISELEKHNQKLRNEANEKDSTSTTLQQQLNLAQDLSADQNTVMLRLRNEISSLQCDITKVREGHPIEGSVSSAVPVIELAHKAQSTETFMKMRERLKEEERKATALTEELTTARQNAEIANSDRMSSYERHCLLSELNIDLLEGELASKPKLDIVEEVRKQHSVALLQLQSEHAALKKSYDRLKQDYDCQARGSKPTSQQTNGSPNPFVDGDSKGAAALRSDTTLRDLIAQSLKPTAESIQDSSHSYEQSIGNLTNKLEEIYARPLEAGREQLVKAQQVDSNLFSSLPSEQLPRRATSVISQQTRRLRCLFWGRKSANAD